MGETWLLWQSKWNREVNSLITQLQGVRFYYYYFHSKFDLNIFLPIIRVSFWFFFELMSSSIHARNIYRKISEMQCYGTYNLYLLVLRELELERRWRKTIYLGRQIVVIHNTKIISKIHKYNIRGPKVSEVSTSCLL